MRAAFASLVAALALVQSAAAVGVWGQCGGKGYTGSTTCDAGSVCTYSNDYYSQCLPGTASSSSSTSSSSSSTTISTSSTSASSSSSSTSAATTTKTTTTATTTTSSGGATAGPGPCSSSRTKFKYFGVNESGAEFGDGKWPGVLDTDYTWPSPSSIDYFVGKGMNTFRVPFMLERMAPNGVASAFDTTYLSGLQTIVNYITTKGAYVLIEPHNYMRYKGAVITSTSDFAAFWKTLAGVFKSNKNVIFDTMNEPNGIDAQTVFNLVQAAVNAIRASGATQQLILVEGTAWTGAWSWVSSGNAAAFANLKDPNNNIAIQMHQYLDSDSSGTSGTCVSSTIGAERLAVATQWLQQTGFKGFLGEIGAGNNQQCVQAVTGAICAMQTAAGSPWIGMTWWAAGPWWHDYFTSIEPPNGPSITGILPALLQFV